MRGYISPDLFHLCCVRLPVPIFPKTTTRNFKSSFVISLTRLLVRKVWWTLWILVLRALVSAGDIHEKSRTVFALYDTDGSQTISLEEFERLLTSVYKVMMAIEPSAKEKAGMSAEELALTTASSVFKEADLDNNGMLEWHEFQKWYEGSDFEEEEEEEAMTDDVIDNLDFVREIALEVDHHERTRNVCQGHG